MNNSKLSYELLELAKKKCEAAEVVFSNSRDLEVSFEHNDLKSVQEDYSSSLGLRLVADNKIGVASTNNLARWEDLVPLALESAQFGPQAIFDFSGAAEFPSVLTYHQPTSTLTPELLTEQGREVVADFLDFNSSIYTNLTFTLSSGTSLVCNTRSLDVTKQNTYLEYSAFWDLVREGNMLQVWEDYASCKDDFNLDYFSSRAKKKIKWAEKQSQIQSGKYPVVFTPAAFASLLSYVTRSLNGKNVVKGVSRLGSKRGEQVFDSRLNIEDNGLLNWKVGSDKFDSEGVPVRQLGLVEDGVVNSFYFDLWSAAKLGEESTGHGARSKHSALATPSLHNLIVGGGDHRAEEVPSGIPKASLQADKAVFDIITGIDNGVLADQFLGVGQDNPYNGDFSMNLNLGYKIENGEIVGRLKDTMIAGNVFDLLRGNLVELSSEREWVGGNKLLPWVVLEGVVVT